MARGETTLKSGFPFDYRFVIQRKAWRKVSCSIEDALERKLFTYLYIKGNIMSFQKTLLATAALAMLALPACAQTYKQANDAELAGGKHLQSVKVIELKGGGTNAFEFETGVIELEGTAMAFLDGDGLGDMDVEVTRGENGEKIIIMNGEKITLKDGTHQ